MDDYALVLNAGSSSLKFCVYRRPDRGRLAARHARPDRRHRDVAALDRQGRRRRIGRSTKSWTRRSATAATALDVLAEWLRGRYGGAPVLGVGHRVVHGGANYAGPRIVTPEVLDGSAHADRRSRRSISRTTSPAIEAVARADARRAAGGVLRHQLPSRPAGGRRTGAAAEGDSRRGRRSATASTASPTNTSRRCCRSRARDRRRPRHRGASRQRREPVRDEGRQERRQHARLHRARRALHGHAARLARSRRASCISSRRWGCRPKEVETLLYKKSGLLGISGISNDMRDLLGSADPAARLAVDYFVYRAAKQIGALAAVLGGVDALVFTAGIGEHSAEIRRRICEASAWLGVELDAERQRRAGAPDLHAEQQGVGVGRPDQRRADDRPAHRAVAGTHDPARVSDAGISATPALPPF